MRITMNEYGKTEVHETYQEARERLSKWLEDPVRHPLLIMSHELNKILGYEYQSPSSRPLSKGGRPKTKNPKYMQFGLYVTSVLQNTLVGSPHNSARTVRSAAIRLACKRFRVGLRTGTNYFSKFNQQLSSKSSKT